MSGHYLVMAWRLYPEYCMTTVQAESAEAAIEKARPEFEQGADWNPSNDAKGEPVHCIAAEPDPDQATGGESNAVWEAPTVEDAARAMLAALKIAHAHVVAVANNDAENGFEATSAEDLATVEAAIAQAEAAGITAAPLTESPTLTTPTLVAPEVWIVTHQDRFGVANYVYATEALRDEAGNKLMRELWDEACEPAPEDQDDFNARFYEVVGDDVSVEFDHATIRTTPEIG